MTTSDWALVISLLSMLIAMGSFIWNVWSKFIFPKPRLQVSFMVMETIPPLPNLEHLLCLSATNHGPGEVVIQLAVARRKRPWYKRRLAHGVLNPIHDLMRPDYGIGPYAAGLPKKLAVGENFSLHFPYVADMFMRERLVAVGVHDSFSRSHWAPLRDFRRAKEQHSRDFPLDA
ncbi:MAG: hypothetical protein EOP09_17355 [Proteobacteria bacterium]|nr:MAG: hypothetical protein EOP09_17355 [Pseudomonadota bacterium]